MLLSSLVDKERIWRVAEGYLELTMFDEALRELQGLTVEIREEERTQELLLAGYMMAELWNKGADAAKKLCAVQPGKVNYFIHAAYCLHETGDTLAAKNWLVAGPKSLMKHALFHYNMGCYYAVLGDPDTAKGYIEVAFKIDETLRDVAASDRDLEEVDLEAI